MLDSQTPLAELQRLRGQWSEELDRITGVINGCDRFSKRYEILRNDREIVMSSVIALTAQIAKAAQK